MYQADYDTGEIFLHDDIDAATVIADLKQMIGGRVTVRISSPGGSVDEGRAIFNALQRHRGGVDVVVDSSAYSIASYIAMAGERIVMAMNAMMMVHNPWTMAFGDANELRKTAEILDKYRDSIIDAYTEKSKVDREDMVALLDAETWYTAQEAVDAGFATEVGDIAIDAPSFAKAMYTGKPTGSKPAEPKAGSRTPWDLSRVARRKSVGAMFGK